MIGTEVVAKAAPDGYITTRQRSAIAPELPAMIEFIAAEIAKCSKIITAAGVRLD